MNLFKSLSLAAQEVGKQVASHRVTIAVPDATRSIDVQSALRPLLELCDPEKTKVVVGLGLHRKMYDVELTELKAIANHFGVELLQHDPHALDLQKTSDEPPGWFRPELLDADFLVNIGVVEPHQYAGFSGGVKGIVIGCGGAKTIAWMHSLTLLRQPGVEVGNIDQNPFQHALWELAKGLPQAFGIYAVSGSTCAFGGPARSTYLQACELASQLHFHDLDEPVDWLHLVVPEPKSSNFYQASRAATYAALVRLPAVRHGGWILVDAPCPEGFGSGEGERAAAARLRHGRSDLIEQLYALSPPITSGGEQRAFVLAMALEKFKIALVGAPEIPELAPIGIPQFPDFEAAANALGLSKNGLKIQHPFSRVPRYAPSTRIEISAADTE